MDKSTYRKEGISLLTGIVKQRDWLVKHDKSHMETAWCKTELDNIRYALPRLKDPQLVKAYIGRKETTLRMLIPSTNTRRQNKLRELLHEEIN
jgi:hypothetical protein